MSHSTSPVQACLCELDFLLMWRHRWSETVTCEGLHRCLDVNSLAFCCKHNVVHAVTSMHMHSGIAYPDSLMPAGCITYWQHISVPVAVSCLVTTLPIQTTRILCHDSQWAYRHGVNDLETMLDKTAAMKLNWHGYQTSLSDRCQHNVQMCSLCCCV